jgi:hypothetical protein
MQKNMKERIDFNQPLSEQKIDEQEMAQVLEKTSASPSETAKPGLEAFCMDIEKINDLPSEKRLKRFGILKENSQKVLEEKHVKELYDMLFASKKVDRETALGGEKLLDALMKGEWPDGDVAATTTIKKLIKEEPEKKPAVQKGIVATIKNKGLSLSLLHLLGELCDSGDYRTDREIVELIEKNEHPSAALMEQIAVLNRLNNSKGNEVMHKVLDYFNQHLFVLQNDPGDEMNESAHKFYVDLHYYLLRSELEHSENYLVKKHLQDQIESLEQAGTKKEGAVSGLAGGTSDNTIYVYRHAREVYQNRIALGVNEGYAIGNPILKIAPNYYGEYDINGKLQKVYESREADPIKADAIVQEKITENNKDYDYIYDELNQPVDTSGRRYADDSYKLEKLRDIWSFKDALKSDKQSFFFDFTRLDLDKLHPVVVSDILHSNFEYLKESKALPGTAALSEDKVKALLSSEQSATDDDLYSFRYLCRLDMRKKIEDDFGIDITKYSIATQKNFLEFLETRDVRNVDNLRDFVQDYGGNGFKSFLSLEQDSGMGEVILSIGEKLKDQPELADKLFAKYAEMVDGAEILVDEFELVHSKVFQKKALERNRLLREIMSSATELISQAAQEIANTEDKQIVISRLCDEIDNDRTIKKASIKDLAAVSADMDEECKKISQDLTYDDLVEVLGDPEKYHSPKELADAIKNGEIEYWWGDWSTNMQEKIKGFDSQALSRLQSGIRNKIEILRKENRDVFEMEARPDFDETKAWEGVPRLKRVKAEIKEREDLIDRLEKFRLLRVNLESSFDTFLHDKDKTNLPSDWKEQLTHAIAEHENELDGVKGDVYWPVGISSELPKEGELHVKPIDALAYLFWMQNQGKKIDLMVVDTIQTSNYQVKYGLDEETAREQALINGRMDKDWYRAMIEAFNLDNIELRPFDDVEKSDNFRESKELVKKAEDSSPLIKRALHNIVEASIKRKVDVGKQEKLTEYGKEEIALIMSDPATKLGHEKEYRYDVLARIIPVYEALYDHLPEIRKEYEDMLRQKGVGRKQVMTMAREFERPKTIDLNLSEISAMIAYYDQYPDDILDVFEKLYHGQASGATAKEKQQNEQDLILDFNDSREGENTEKRTGLSLKEAWQERIKESGSEDIEISIRKMRNELSLLSRGDNEIVGRWRAFANIIRQKEWFKDLRLPEFRYPKGMKGYSFEMRDDAGREYGGFKEFYSSIKGSHETDTLIASNQLAISSNRMAMAKLLVLSPERQQDYFRHLLRPLLINYYLATSDNREEAMRRLESETKDIKTMGALVAMIQDKIVAPIEKVLEKKKQ